MQPDMMQSQSSASTAALPEPVLEIQGLTKQFGGLRAVGDFDLTVRKGALDGLIGPKRRG